jgi:hypothetical protein
MSYARFSHDGSDVYVFASDAGLECCGCWLRGDSRQPVTFRTTAEMIAHLIGHVAAGHSVPRYCFDGLMEDADENDREYA